MPNRSGNMNEQQIGSLRRAVFVQNIPSSFTISGNIQPQMTQLDFLLVRERAKQVERHIAIRIGFDKPQALVDGFAGFPADIFRTDSHSRRGVAVVFPHGFADE